MNLFEELNKPSFFEECDDIFDEFIREEMPPQNYGYRSWKIEKAFEKHSNGKFKYVGNKPEEECDFIYNNSEKIEFKQVKDACKKFMTPLITLKNWRKNNLGNYEPPFDYLVVVDVDRKAMLAFDSNYVSDKTENNDATVTCKLELSKAVQTETLNSLV